MFRSPSPSARPRCRAVPTASRACPGHLDVFEITGDRHSAIVISQPESPEGKDDNPRLVFHRYGDSYFLREIRLPGSVAMSLPPTRLEHDAAERLVSNAAPAVVVIDTRQ